MELERKIIAGMLICGVGGAFIVISVLVVLTGRNPYFVKQKLTVGALLLSLSAIMSGCKGPGPGGVITCYSIAVEESATIDGISNGQIVLDRKVTDTMNCSIKFPESNNYSVIILDSVNNPVIKETVYSDTISRFGQTINFPIGCDKGISQGIYSLRIFNDVADSVQNADDYRYIYTLKIVN